MRQRGAIDSHYEVIIVGAGPTGLTAANVLAHAGHHVAIFERHPTLYNLPRAGHIDTECLRVLQGIGCLDAVMEDAYPIRQVPLLDAAGEFLMELVPAHQSSSSFRSVMMYQPLLEEALFRELGRHRGFADLHLGWTVNAVEQDEGSVYVEARRTESAEGRECGVIAPARISCDYLIAADGASSAIREGLGIEREDFGISERWLDIDLAYRRPCDFGVPRLFADPKRPLFLSPLGRTHHRFECQLFPNEPTPEFSTPEKAWMLMAQRGITQDDVEIVRQAVYIFEYRLAQRWRERRIFLMGDAAHTMSPLLGQGMSSGMRDAANLGWKLDLVLRGRLDDSMLDSYQTERRPHVKTWGDLSVTAGHFICETDPEKAAARDAFLRQGGAPPLRPPPTLTSGLFDLSFNSPAVGGHLFPQRNVRMQGRVGLFDDIAGEGFFLVSRGDPRPFLSAADARFMERVGMRCLRFSKDVDDARVLSDETGEYARFFQENAVEAVIVRPDRYVFGAVAGLTQLGVLMGKLAGALGACDV
jgi:3-(3-hydroxy-phenyl)propionate hydroxylase